MIPVETLTTMESATAEKMFVRCGTDSVKNKRKGGRLDKRHKGQGQVNDEPE
ncbi:MAG: hypothetical protein ACREOZ_03240 [Gloeomargaritales cyanobacterium]